MYYFLLQKLSPLTQRWRLVEVAFDPTYDYLYYSAPLERTDIAHYAHYHERCDEDEHDARLPSRSPELRVRWRHKLKLTALHYAADDYAVPASSQDFKEAILLTFTVDGVERRLPSPQTATAHKATQSSTTVSGFGTSVQSLTSTADLKARQTTRQHASTRSRRKSTITTMRSGVAAVETARSSTSTSLQHLHSASYSQCESGSFGSPDLLRSPGAGAKNIRNINSRGEEDDDENDNDALAHAAALTVATPEYPSLRLDVHTIHLSADGPAADLEDEVENVFRVNDLAPSSSSSSSEEESDDEDEEEEATSEEEEAEGTDSTTTTATENESDAEDAAATASRRDRDEAEVTSRRSSHVARRAGRDSGRHYDNQHYHGSGGNNGRETEGNEAMTAVAAPRREDDNDDEDSAGGSTEESLAHRFTFGLFGRKVNKPRSLTFRALSYEAFRIVSLRLRQALVRHGYCAPLHAGLPLYDPRNGIALATVPLHLRYIFRRLNDVVFYSLQCGHTVYVRHYREVRGFYGYLCITHDTVLLLQEDGRCPRWLDLADITGVDYVLQGKNSFVAIRAAAPCADFVFIPVFPAYPYCVDFDAEETVEGIVSMLRRLLRQRLRLHEDVSLPPPSTTSPRRRPQDRSVTTHCDEGCGNNDESDDEDDDSDGDDDRLCHIADCSRLYGDVFRYIAARGAERFMLSRGMCGKAPQHFTYKRDLVAALRRGDDDEDDNREDDDDDVQREGGAVQGSRAGRGQAGSAGDIQHRRENLQRSQEPHSRLLVHAHGEAILPAVGQRRGEDDATRARCGGAMPLSGELASQASFTTMTVSHLLAPPSHAAELRARDRLRLTRTDPQQRRRRRQEQQHGDKEEEHYTHEVDGDNSRECDRRVALASATRRVAATASETRHRDPGHLTQARPDSSSHSVPSLHGSGVVMGVVVAGGAGQRPVKAPTCVVTPAEDVFTDSKHGIGHVKSGAQGGTRQAAAAVSRGSEVHAMSAGTIAAPVATAPHREAASATVGTALATRLPSPGSPTGLGSTRSKRNSYGLVPVTSPVGGAAPGSLGGSGDSRSGGAHNETNAKVAVTTVMVVPANKGARLPLQTAATTTMTAAATTQGTAAKAATAHPDKLVVTSSEDEDEEEEDDDSFDSEDVNDLLETAH